MTAQYANGGRVTTVDFSLAARQSFANAWKSYPTQEMPMARKSFLIIPENLGGHQRAGWSSRKAGAIKPGNFSLRFCTIYPTS